MCGIAGVIALSGFVDPTDIIQMTDLVRYRGPDDHGYVGFCRSSRQAVPFKSMGEIERKEIEEFSVVFGHRRLSIIDLSSAGHGPMQSSDGTLWITYNGEVFNYVELRNELIAKGHHFRSQTDTEVILAAYREWGVECLNKFNGMWAFAILDTSRMEVFCARDRLGVKPFYFHYDGRRFSFSSEIKQLLQLNRVGKEAHPGVLFDFLVFDTYGCTSEQTFFKDVRDMRGGRYLQIPLTKTTWVPEPVPWWDIDLRRKTLGWTPAQYAHRYRELFEDAVRLRLRSDVRVGSCLSGGLDSSGIVCVVDKLRKEARVEGMQDTFTATSANPAYDERNYAEEVIRSTAVRPFWVEPAGDGLLNEFKKLVWHQDEPFVSSSIYASWCVYRLAREQGVTVTLDGQGPDEMLGGYIPFMYPARMVSGITSGDFRGMLKLLRDLRESLNIPLKDIARDVLRELQRGILPARFLNSLRRGRELLHDNFFEEGSHNSLYIERLSSLREWRVQKGGTRFDQLLYRFTREDSLPGILRQVDRNSMAFSIEARVPFLDYRLVEYTFSLPDREKLDGGVSKGVYRRAMADLLPPTIGQRRTKFGFVTNEIDWLRGPLSSFLNDTLESISINSPYKKERIMKEVERRLAGRAPFDTLIWKTLCSQQWLLQNRIS